MALSCSQFCYYKHFNRQFAYAVSFISKSERYVWVKRFCINTLLLFLPCLGQLHLWKRFMSLHRTKILKENIRHSSLFELGKWNNRHLSGFYHHADPLDYRLNMCVTVCLWTSYFESIFLFSNPWKLPKKKRFLNFSRTQMKETQLSKRTDKIVFAKPFHTEHPRQGTIAQYCIEKCIHKDHLFSIIVKGSILAKAFNFELCFPYLWWIFVSKA